MKSFFLFFIFLFFVTAEAQNFYDLNTIQKIEVTFPMANWDAKMDSTGITENFMLATHVVINGVNFDSVGVKYKGNSSFNVNNKKNPWHIELDNIITSQEYQGVTDIKLGNNFADPSFLREVMGYKILSNYMHCPRGNYVNLYVNGVYRGLYTNEEAVTKTFCFNHFFEKDGPFFKCNKPVPGAIGSPNLVPSADPTMADSLTYYARIYEIKSDWGWKQFIQAQKDLQNSIDTSWDVDRALWMFTFNNVFVNLDSYTGNTTQNYYEYMDSYHKFNSIIWDINMCMGGFTQLVTGSPLSFIQMQQMSLMANATLANHPLMSKLLINSRYKKQYIAHLRTMVDEALSSNYYYTLGTTLRTLIDTTVLADSLKFYTYSAFKSNLDTVATLGGTSQKIGIRQLLDARRNYLLSTPEFIQIPPAISSIKFDIISPAVNDVIWIRAKLANANYGYLGVRDFTAKHFSRITLVDDGLHHDSLAGDGLYGVSFKITSGKMEYYLYAENANAGIFSPVRAEHEFYTLTASIPMLPIGSIVMNELMASNSNAIKDPAGEYDDWVELKNRTSTTVNLSGMYLSDDPVNLAKWAFPDGTILPANAYMLVWLDGDITQAGLHANFKLSSAGEDLRLGYANGFVLDSILFPLQKTDSSYGRCVDGSGGFKVLVNPTPNTTNNCSSTRLAVPWYSTSWSNEFRVYPNPAKDLIQITGEHLIRVVSLQNTIGQELLKIENMAANQASLDVSRLPKGMYIIQINGSQTSKMVLR